MTRGRASGEMHLSQNLRRLPQVAALFEAGRLSYRICRTIAWRTDLVDDEQAMTLIDGALAAAAAHWGPMSDYKLEQVIDLWINRYDPGALRRTRANARSRDVTLGSRDDEAGTTALTGRLYSTDAALLDRRLTQLAHGVCKDDPRTIAQHRADALGALAAGADRLACTCGAPTCPAAADDGRAASVVIHVLAEAEALTAAPDPAMSGQGEPLPPITRKTTLAELMAPRPEPAPTAPPATAVIAGPGGIVPAPLLAQLIHANEHSTTSTSPNATHPRRSDGF